MNLTNKQIDRFWQNVNITDSCWLWMSYKNEKGYGRFGVNYHHEYAHRISYFLTKGSIPKGLSIDHLCRNTSCVNPDHLEVVTQRINILRGESIFAKEARQTHCIHGHEFTLENTSNYGGHRKCKKCGVQNARNFRTNNPDYEKNRYWSDVKENRKYNREQGRKFRAKNPDYYKQYYQSVRSIKK